MKNRIIGAMRKYDLLRRIYVRGRSKGLMQRGQFPMLKHIAGNGGITQAETAELLGISPAAVACSAQRMIAAGLIERRTDERDRRRLRLYATPLGERSLDEMRVLLDEADSRTFEGFTEDELATLEGYLDRMADNIAGGGGGSSIPELVKQLRMIEEGNK